MGPSNFWTEEEVELLKHLVREGWTNKEISEVLGRSLQSIRTTKYRVGIKSPPQVRVANMINRRPPKQNRINTVQKPLKIGAPE